VAGRDERGGLITPRMKSAKMVLVVYHPDTAVEGRRGAREQQLKIVTLPTGEK
jgi:hypothetical protein